MKKLLLLPCLALLAACGEPTDNSTGNSTDEQPDSTATETTEPSTAVVLEPGNLNVAFYNVENLFDTIDAPDKEDEEWLPSSEKQWTSERYLKKLDDLSKVLSALFSEEGELPGIIGLCEVENRTVVEDLVNTGELDGVDYGVAHVESPDVRGIDVALAYDKARFELLHQQAITVVLPDPERPHTRDILYVKGRVSNDETLHLFVNHWPSRRGGAEESEPKRMLAASRLKSVMDSVRGVEPNANILVMGDFNDYPANNSISVGIPALGAESYQDGVLINAMSYKQEGEGTYNYKGEWGCLDQFLLSGSMHNEQSVLRWNGEGNIYKEEWILYIPENGDAKPNRTYGGPNYYGGYSDHLPIYTTLIVNQK